MRTARAHGRTCDEHLIDVVAAGEQELAEEISAQQSSLLAHRASQDQIDLRSTKKTSRFIFAGPERVLAKSVFEYGSALDVSLAFARTGKSSRDPLAACISWRMVRTMAKVALVSQEPRPWILPSGVTSASKAP